MLKNGWMVLWFQELMCNFQPDCPEGEDEITCPAFFNFDFCDDVVKFY